MTSILQRLLVCIAFLSAGALHARDTAAPSTQLDPVLTTVLDAIQQPLEKDPKLPRTDVDKLRAVFAGEAVTAATPAGKAISQNAMAVCDSLTKAMDERIAAKAAADASAKAPSLTSGGGINKASPMRGVDAGAAGDAARKKEKDKRKYEDNRAEVQSRFVQSGAYRAWAEKATVLRKNAMALYTKQVQLEAAAGLDAPKPAAASPSKKGERRREARQDSADMITGKWVGTDNPDQHHEIKADKTCTRMTKGGKLQEGTWEWIDRKALTARVKFDKATLELTVRPDGKSITAHNLSEKSKGSINEWKREE